MSGPLDGVRIADFTTAHQGPWATQKLGDLGAEVIKIERVDGEWSRNLTTGGGHDIRGMSPFWLSANRSKQSVAIDLKDHRGHEAVMEIISDSDVLIENFRPGVMDRLDLNYEAVSQDVPEIIYVSASGYGSDGPYADRPGQDLLLQGLSGMTTAVGHRDDPPTPIPFPVVDGHSAMHIVNYTLSALFHRERSGEGQHVEVNLLNAAIDTQCQALTVETNIDHEFFRSEQGIGQKYLDAPYGLYQTADGYIAIAMASMDQLADVLGLEDLREYEPPETYEKRDEIKACIEDYTREQATDALLDRLIEADVWAARVNDYRDVASDPQVQHNDMIVEVSHPDGGMFTTTGITGSLSATPPSIQCGPPGVGEHTKAILERVGFSVDEIDELADDGVVNLGQ